MVLNTVHVQGCKFIDNSQDYFLEQCKSKKNIHLGGLGSLKDIWIGMVLGSVYSSKSPQTLSNYLAFMHTTQM